MEFDKNGYERANFRSISFLTKDENQVMYHLIKATELFDQLCEKDPQSPTDDYNFGHYVDAAKNAVILRGARRMDPETLIIERRKKSQFIKQGTQQDPAMWDAAEKRMDKLFGENPLNFCMTENGSDGGESGESSEGN